MGKKRRQFSSELKLEAVRLFESGNLPASQVAKDLGIDPGRLRIWCGISRNMDRKHSQDLALRQVWMSNQSACNGKSHSSKTLRENSIDHCNT